MIVINQVEEVKKLKEFEAQLEGEYNDTCKKLNELLEELKPLYKICDTKTTSQLIAFFMMIFIGIALTGMTIGLFCSVIIKGFTYKQLITLLACIVGVILLVALNSWITVYSKTYEQVEAMKKIEELHYETRTLYALRSELYTKTNKAVPYAYASTDKVKKLIKIIEDDKAKTIHGAIYCLDHNKY